MIIEKLLTPYVNNSLKMLITWLRDVEKLST